MVDQSAYNFVLVGVGGQGTLLASNILAEVGLAAGFDAKKSEVHGMAQRGGSVLSHVRWHREQRLLAARRPGRGRRPALLREDGGAALRRAPAAGAAPRWSTTWRWCRSRSPPARASTPADEHLPASSAPSAPS